jgi:hypothetical protein
MFKLANDLQSAYNSLHFSLTPFTFAKVVRAVQRANKHESASTVASFINGGEDGWSCGPNVHQNWLDKTPSHEIADWVIAGLK